MTTEPTALRRVLLAAALLLTGAFAAHAEAVQFSALMAQREAIRLDFPDSEEHFFAMVHREGKSEGNGPLAGVSVQEYSAHDIAPGVGGQPFGYLEFIHNGGEKAFVRWTINAGFERVEGRLRLNGSGSWKVIGGTGGFANLKGSGTLQLSPLGPFGRRFDLKGDLTK